MTGQIETVEDQTAQIEASLRPYKPDEKKFAEYVEWRRKNPTGTYADFRKGAAR